MVVLKYFLLLALLLALGAIGDPQGPLKEERKTAEEFFKNLEQGSKDTLETIWESTKTKLSEITGKLAGEEVSKSLDDLSEKLEESIQTIITETENTANITNVSSLQDVYEKSVQALINDTQPLGSFPTNH